MFYFKTISVAIAGDYNVLCAFYSQEGLIAYCRTIVSEHDSYIYIILKNFVIELNFTLLSLHLVMLSL
jgi:hypothetical protein